MDRMTTPLAGWFAFYFDEREPDRTALVKVAVAFADVINGHWIPFVYDDDSNGFVPVTHLDEGLVLLGVSRSDDPQCKDRLYRQIAAAKGLKAGSKPAEPEEEEQEEEREQETRRTAPRGHVRIAL